MAKTKLGPASRFGARYGSSLKKIVAKIETSQKAKHTCPVCKRKSMRRRGYARWECTKCGAVMAGGAYEPRTELGKTIELIVRRRQNVEMS